MNNVMEFLGMENEKGEQVESSLHSNPSLYEQEDNQPSVVQEECYNLFDEECNQSVTNFVCGGFEEDFSPPIYDEYEDGYSEDEGPKWDVSSCFSNSEFSCQEEFISLDFLEGATDISAEAHKENQVVTLEIVKDIVDAPFETCHEHYFQGSCKKQFDSMQVEL